MVVRRRRQRWAAWFAAAAVMLYFGVTAPAQARSNNRTDAKAAYDKGLAAVQQKQFAEAARWFAEADRLAPNPVALTSALRAAIDADEGPLAMELAERAASRAAPPAGEAPAANADFRAAAADARAKFEAQTGRLEIRCGTAARCHAELAERELTPGTPVWVEAGEQRLLITADGVRTPVEVSVRPGQTRIVEPPAAAPAAPSPPSSAPSSATAPGSSAPSQQALPSESTPSPESPAAGLPPVLFWVALGTTAALGAVTIGSGIDTKAKRDEWERTGLGGDEGEAAQLRTNLLFTATAAAAVTTLVFGLLTDWDGSGQQNVALALAPSRGQLLVHGSF